MATVTSAYLRRLSEERKAGRRKECVQFAFYRLSDIDPAH